MPINPPAPSPSAPKQFFQKARTAAYRNRVGLFVAAFGGAEGALAAIMSGDILLGAAAFLAFITGALAQQLAEGK